MLPPMSRPRLLPAVTAVAVCAATVAPVAADTEPRLDRGLAWGGLTLEASMAGVFAINFGTRLVPNHGPGLLFNFTPMVLAPGVGWLMRDVDADPAYALHGAAWAGFDLFLLGALIDGRHDRDRKVNIGKEVDPQPPVGCHAQHDRRGDQHGGEDGPPDANVPDTHRVLD